jgi:hypothetical protein
VLEASNSVRSAWQAGLLLQYAAPSQLAQAQLKLIKVTSKLNSKYD